ncbi:DNA replication licensing factor MCM4 [Sarcoptes scabiei]|uniref:DNA replication licensing factor MCM4 n=1 Tax=Sarcoptes scabiei TaxID=52283 RepID=A0A834RDI5_SARSC|nr:DNA replication licensing factor MCM4 [Sarcoptes scabiei]
MSAIDSDQHSQEFESTKRPRSPSSSDSLDLHQSKRLNSNGDLSNGNQMNGNHLTTNITVSNINGASTDNHRIDSDQLSNQSKQLGMLSQEFGFSSPMPYDVSSELSQLPTILNNYRRDDIRNDAKNVKQINLTSQLDHGPVSESSVSQSGPQLVVWGTDVSINECRQKFKKFIHHFKFNEEDLCSDEIQMSQDYFDSQFQDSYYTKKIRECLIIGDYFLNVNCQHLLKYDENLYRQLVSYPQEVIPTFDMALNEIVNEFDNRCAFGRICVRPFNVTKTSSIRNLNPEDINQLVTISGMVTRSSNIIAEMSVAFFECSVCSYSVNVEVDRGLIPEPQVCQNCDTRFSFKLIHNRSKFTDKQQVKLQESPDDMPAGQTPYTVLLCACSDLVDKVQPGERVTVTGIYRATPIRVNPKIRNVKSVYRTHVDVVHYRKIENKRLHDSNQELKLTKERIDRLIALSNSPDIYERLAHSLAPSIYEHENIKKGILLQLFGGTKKQETLQTDSNTKNTFRSEINILLCGDPGTSKSQLLQYVYNLVPRGQYTSGKGSSAVGLTAYITKDPDTKQLVLQTGALVLSDGGICCIDEFDKMNESTRSILHEVMEQQTLSIAKAGIVCQLNARTSILAAANPIESSWNKNKSVTDNIQLPPTLMSRFDLIFLLLDPQDNEYDRKLAKHLVSLYYKTNEENPEVRKDLLDMGLLKDYIGYARANFHPVLSPEAQASLKNAYVEMRKVGSNKGHITAYPRQLESLIRLAEAHAKLRFKNVVDVDDVTEARRLQREALLQSAIDPVSGTIDVSILTTGVSTHDRRMKNELMIGLKQLLNAMKNQKTSTKASDDNFIFLEYQTVFNEFRNSNNQTISKETFEEALNALQTEGLFEFTNNRSLRIKV